MFGFLKSALSAADLAVLADAAKTGIARRGVGFFSWRNAPEWNGKKFTQLQGWGDSTETVTLTPDEALGVGRAKLDGAYGERFALSVAWAIQAAKQGVPVHLLQKIAEKGVPFDATGWLILAINGHPVFHISPDDLDPAMVEEITLLVEEGSEADEAFGWKGTNKVGELCGLIDAALGQGFNPARV